MQIRAAIAVLMFSANAAIACTLPVTSFSDVEAVGPLFSELARNRSNYFKTDLLAGLINAPPRHGSAAHCAEIDVLKKYTTSADQRRKIACQAELSCWEFSGIRLVDLRHKKYSQTLFLIENALQHLNGHLFALKQHFDRPRPSMVTEEIQTVIPNPKHASYPSGHASQGILIGYILALLQPELADKIMKDAQTLGRNRERAGVHFASDTTAGWMLGELVFATLSETPWFVLQLKKARQEWR